MPGIVGMISQRPLGECEAIVQAMTRSMEHEAFYTSGSHEEPAMGICCGWVAHQGALAAGQIFWNEQKDIALLFAGECFIDPETRSDLQQQGHDLGPSQGGWLVHLYEEKGEDFFGQLNGLFSGLLIDKRRRRAFLFNDRYGMERIYCCETKDAFFFASEAKALLRVLPDLRAFNEEGVVQFLTFGCTLEGRTLFRGVSLLPGGALWSFQNGTCRKAKYFTPAEWESQEPLSEDDFETEFAEIFKRILPRYFETDSRIGISLTGGLDTRMIMASRPPTHRKPVCYTFAGENGDTLDAHLAARLAKTCGLEHRILRIGPDFFSDFASHADRTVYITDGCFGVLGAHEIYLNRQARQVAPMRLTGVFGSEILRGMSTFKPVGLSQDLLNPQLCRSVNSDAQKRSRIRENPVTFAAFREIPWNIFGSLAACRSQTTFRTPYLDNALVALSFRAPEQLRKSPVSALRFVKAHDSALAVIPTDKWHAVGHAGPEFAFKRLFAQATFKLDYFYNEGMPHWISRLDPFLDHLTQGVRLLGLHKFLHYRRWFRRELAEHLGQILDEVQARRCPIWNPRFLKQMAREHIRGRKNYIREINAVLTLEAVDRLLIQKRN